MIELRRPMSVATWTYQMVKHGKTTHYLVCTSTQRIRTLQHDPGVFCWVSRGKQTHEQSSFHHPQKPCGTRSPSRSPALPLCFPAARPRWTVKSNPGPHWTTHELWSQYVSICLLRHGFLGEMGLYWLYDANCNIWERYIWLNDVRSFFCFTSLKPWRTRKTTLKQQRFRGEVSGGITWYKHS